MDSQEYKNLKSQIDELTKQLASLKASATIPLDVGEAMKIRMLDAGILRDVPVLKSSAKEADSEDIDAVTAVNFGASTVTKDAVLGNPAGFLEVDIQGTLYYIPYFA